MSEPQKYQPGEIIATCAGRSRDALEFLTAFHRLVHGLDDVADAAEDKRGAMSPEQWVTPLREFIEVCLVNPFAQDHNRELRTLISHACAAWLDANRIENRASLRDRAVADVLKSQYHEVFWYVARAANDWHYMRKCQETFREWDWD